MDKRVLKYAFFPLTIFISMMVAGLLLTQAHAMEPGFTPGEFAVDESGAAQYTVPLAVPPATAGMGPALVLRYNSRSGNGLLGQDWTLGGLSVVTRCAPSFGQDGFVGGISFDENDRYCIDGQRLIAISGTDGSDGTEYRTEIDAFTKVISHGQQGNGPAWFEVWTKSGQHMRYGFTEDARIEAHGRDDVRLWAVDRITDTAGNYLTVNYIENDAEGSYRPDSILYTGNEQINLLPYNKVHFDYESRPDITTSYRVFNMR
ncbi:MAG: SpvB/TcaC N-terminal domain-containing protein [Candidatus Competibacteraceae bacterium]